MGGRIEPPESQAVSLEDSARKLLGDSQSRNCAFGEASLGSVKARGCEPARPSYKI